MLTLPLSFTALNMVYTQKTQGMGPAGMKRLTAGASSCSTSTVTKRPCRDRGHGDSGRPQQVLWIAPCLAQERFPSAGCFLFGTGEG